mmetsp:Transcript_1075/g.3360  ORF Transcript_1075/g.3360 Transcript_1075/m.3360 type:complete len:346 (-) Transcript_1075:314-1351(-)
MSWMERRVHIGVVTRPLENESMRETSGSCQWSLAMQSRRRVFRRFRGPRRPPASSSALRRIRQLGRPTAAPPPEAAVASAMVSSSIYVAVTYVPPSGPSLRASTKSRSPSTIRRAAPPSSTVSKRGAMKRTSRSSKTASSKSCVCAGLPWPRAKICSTICVFSFDIRMALSGGPPASSGAPPSRSRSKSARPSRFFAVRPVCDIPAPSTSPSVKSSSCRYTSASSFCCASSAAIAESMSPIKSSPAPAFCALTLSFLKSPPRPPCRRSLKAQSSQTKSPDAFSAQQLQHKARGHRGHSTRPSSSPHLTQNETCVGCATHGADFFHRRDTPPAILRLGSWRLSRSL